jgi:ABC-type transport system involved in multi-copper enzyme maturation permease subunit
MRKSQPLRVLITATIVTLVSVVPRVLLACAVCYGAPGAAQTKGMNLGIITMLGVTGVVLGGFAAMIFCFARRARRYGAAMTP